LFLHQVIERFDGIVNHGILIGKLLLPGDWTFDFGLDFPNQGFGLGVHWIGPHRMSGFSVPSGPAAGGPTLPSGTGRSLADSDPVTPVAVEGN
jgi:hypothetical protein